MRREPGPALSARTWQDEWTPQLTRAVKAIPAGDDRAAFYEVASLVTLVASGAGEILDTVTRAERTLTRQAADALWVHAEQRAPTLCEGTRALSWPASEAKPTTGL